MAAKIFEVGDVLPATTQLRIGWVGDITNFLGDKYIYSDNGHFELVSRFEDSDNIYIARSSGAGVLIFYGETYIFVHPYTNYNGDHPYCDIDTSTWDINSRTVSSVSPGMDVFTWEDLNAPSGYTISFNSNGGTSISDIEDATELPTPLPTPTKSGYTFVAWYYDSAFTQKAKAGDTIESNVTLYAKWHNLGSLFTEIANAIRSKDGTSESIRDVDFGERVNALPSPKEEETKTVTPDFSSGNVVVTPTSGKVMTQVTIQKDANLLADNIKKDVTVHGITGTLESGGGFADQSRVMPLAFQLSTSKQYTASSKTLNYSISSSMLDKRFFFDMNGNSYLPSQVSVYYNNTLKGSADTSITLVNTTDYIPSRYITFKVGSLEVGIPTYYYAGGDEVLGTGISTEGLIQFSWSDSGAIVTPNRYSIRFIQAPNDLFDNFPYSDTLNYWKVGNMLGAIQISNLSVFKVGWWADDWL